jgi:hypothetical protein
LGPASHRDGRARRARGQLGVDALRRAAAACVTHDTCGAEYLTPFAGAEPVLALPDLPDQTAGDRDLAAYEAFVGR